MGLGVPPVTTAFTRSQRRGELGAGGATEDGEAGRRDRSARGNAEGVGLRGTWSSFGSNGTARTISSRGRQREPGARESCSSFLHSRYLARIGCA